MNPPPPPPHGEVPKSSGLPPGKYDIFIIPPHSSGSGFLYLPSLQPNINSFAAGFASALILVALGSMLAPAFHIWWHSAKNSGGLGMFMLMIAIGVGAWALGRIQSDGGPGPGGGFNGGVPPPQGDQQQSSSQSHGYTSGGAGPTPRPAQPGPEQPKPSGWQRTNPPPGTTGANNANTGDGAAKGAWEKAREETKRRAEEQKAKEAERKRKEELEQKLREAREKEARERANRERLAKEKEARDLEAKLAREKEAKDREARERLVREKEARERETRERLAREKREREREKELEKKEQELKKKEQELKEQERKDLERRELERKEAERKELERKEFERKERERKEKEQKAKEEAERPRGSTYAFSAVGERTNPWPNGHPSTNRSQPATTRSQPPSPTKRPPPPPSARTYLGTDEDAFSARPYDKARKPMHKKSHSSLYSDSSYAASQSTSRTTPPPSHRGPYTTKDPDKIVIKAVYSFNHAFTKTPTSQLVSGVGSVTDGLILRITTEGLFIDDDVRGVPQREWDIKAWTMKLVETGELKSAGLHILRASIRDQEGKKYVFVITEEESSKVALGLQRLRKGTQVRALGVSGMSTNDARTTLENLGWT